jgi:hypothetical protein
MKRRIGLALLWLAGACGGIAGAPAIETGVPDETFASLDIDEARLAGVFRYRDLDVVFESSSDPKHSGYRLARVDGSLLVSAFADGQRFVMEVGDRFRHEGPAVQPSEPNVAESHPDAPTEGDAPGAMTWLLAQPEHAALPHLSAALARIGLTGQESAPARPIHYAALGAAKMGASLDAAYVARTNELAQRVEVAPADGVTAARSALTSWYYLCDYKGQYKGLPTYCSNANGYGRYRQYWGPDCLYRDPCGDNCRGMCGDKCSRWTWLCGDDRAHALCWEHDRWDCHGYSWYDPRKYTVQPACNAAYGVYSARVAASSILLCGTPLYPYEMAATGGAKTLAGSW